MKNFFKKVIVVALVVANATLVLAQERSLDSVLESVDTRLKLSQFSLVNYTFDSLRQEEIYLSRPATFKIDLKYVSLLRLQKNDEEALDVLLRNLQNSSSEGYHGFASDFSFEIGRYFASNMNNYDKAFEYYRKSKGFSLSAIDSLRLSKSNLGIGSVHLKIYQRFQRGRVKMDSLLLNIHRDSALYYHQIASNSFPKQETNKEFLGTLNRNFMIFYFYEKSYDLAEDYGNRSLKIFRKMNDTLNLAQTLNVFGATKLLLLDYKRAEEYYLQAENLVHDMEGFEAVDSKERFLNNLSDLYSQTKEFEKAYNFRKTAHLLRDSIYNISTDALIAESEIIYNFSEKEKIAERETSRRQRTELWLYIISVVSVLVLVLLWVIFRSNRLKREKRVLELKQETLLQERTLEKVQNEAQIKILNATIDGKETERRHIAEILHNSVSALLSSAGLHLQAAKISLKEKAPEEIEKSQAIVSEAGEKIRDLSHTLISSVLLKFGLGYAMDDLCEKYSNSKLTFSSDSVDVQRFEGEFEIKIHSIIEELINNILKHSNATHASILLKQFDGKLEIRIFDDGTGFDVSKMQKRKNTGLGLTQIEARIKMMDGVFDIKSSKETGTRIYINVPVPVKV